MSELQSSSSQLPEPPLAVEQTFKVFRPPQTTTDLSQLEQLPESYFSPTSGDVQTAQAHLAAKHSALVDAPLQFRSVKEAADRTKKLQRYPTTRIRIKFTDRTQLEKSFPSTDKIRAVYAFVRGSLREDAKPTKFILYQPPRRDLKVSDPTVRDLALVDLQLSPSSLLLLRFEDDAMNGADYPAPLSESVLAQVEDLPAPPDYNAIQAAPATTSSGAPTKKAGGEKKIPKWLQAGLRKK